MDIFAELKQQNSLNHKTQTTHLNPSQVCLVTLLSMMLVPAQPLPLPNPAPAPFEPITTLIAAKLFLGGIDTHF